MRTLLPLALLLAVAAGAFAARAVAEDGPSGPDAELRDRVAALEAKVKYLQSRETALTAYVLANEARAASLLDALRLARREGFTGGAISAPSREALLRGLEGYADALGKDLPEPTKEERAMQKTFSDPR